MSGWRRREGAHRGANRLSSVATAPVSSIMSTSPQNILRRDHDYVQKREDIGERTNGGVIHGSESSFVVSGELFLRSMQDLLFNDDLAQLPIDQDPPLQQSTIPAKTCIHAEITEAAATGTTNISIGSRHPSAGLLAGLSNEFRNLLLHHPDLDTTGVVNSESDPARDEQQGSSATFSPCERSGDCLAHLLSSARRERRLVRLKRMERLEASKMTVKCMATARMMAVQKGADEFKQHFGEEIKRVESDLYSLILRFAAAVKADMAEENRLTAAERDLCEREKERLDMAARFASLAATVEHRTRGHISLRRLTPTHPQYARCMRAATENLKPGFFSDDSPYSALRVLDVYKIDNRCLLEKFQRTVEATESPKVKGLFCRIPDESLEHVVLNGMGSFEGERTTNASSSAHRSAWDGYPIDPIWVARNKGPFRYGEIGGRGNEDATHDTAVNFTRPSKPLEFPRAFSRYSTLEEEREYANSPKKIQEHLKNQKDFDEGSSASCLRMIALCRVMIGRLRASSSVPCTYDAGVSADTESVTAQRSAQRVTFPPGANPQPSVAASPCSSPGEAKFDSMYFPCEKEYRLFNKAYIVPEFIVVHRFVARPRTKSPPSLTVARRPRAVTFSGGSLRTAVGTQGGERRDRSDGNSVGASRSAALVTARKETVMNRAKPSAPVMLVSPSSFEGLSRPSADWTRDDGIELGSRCKTGGSDVEAVWIRDSESQERGNARVDREFIMSAVEDTFERFWFKLDELRKFQQDTVVKSATRAQVP